MAIDLSPVAFIVDIKGETTGEEFKGNFAVKRFFSQRDRIQKDSIRRNTLGPDSDQASVDAVVRAEMLSHLAISIKEAPQWWKDSSNGLDLFDDNLIVALYQKVVEIQQLETKEVVIKGEEAAKELRKKAKEKKKETDTEE